MIFVAELVRSVEFRSTCAYFDGFNLTQLGSTGCEVRSEAVIGQKQPLIGHMKRILQFFFLVLAVVGCSNEKPQSYRANAQVDGFQITVEMAPSHPFLNEYKKHIEIKRASKTLASFDLSDPGGFATLYVVVAGERMLVLDGLMNGKVIDKNSGSASEIDPSTVPSDFSERNIGVFKFAESPHGYRWVSALQSPD